MLIPALHEPPDRIALRFGDRRVGYAELRDAAAAISERVSGARRVAVWAVNEPEVVAAVAGALAAGVPVVPINPKAGERELGHILSDSEPELVLVPPGLDPPVPEPVAVDLGARGGDLPTGAGDEDPAIVVYTSGTTGPPKGAVLPPRAIASNLDALAQAWEWTADDVVAHGLPLFHVHGLILGSLGPLRLGGGVHHLGRFSPQAAAAALNDGATMLFAVPTMYHRLASECEQDEALAAEFGGARLLVSGSAALPAIEHERIERLTGQRIAERYGMTETLMNTAVRADGERRPGYVGPPLDGVEIRLVDDAGSPIEQPTTRRSARSTCAARTCSSSTSTSPTRPPRPSRTAGSTPATSPHARPTATSGSSGGGRPT